MNRILCTNLLDCFYGNSKLCRYCLECQAQIVIKRGNERRKGLLTKTLTAEDYGFPEEWDLERGKNGIPDIEG